MIYTSLKFKFYLYLNLYPKTKVFFLLKRKKNLHFFWKFFFAGWGELNTVPPSPPSSSTEKFASKKTTFQLLYMHIYAGKKYIRCPKICTHFKFNLVTYDRASNLKKKKLKIRVHFFGDARICIHVYIYIDLMLIALQDFNWGKRLLHQLSISRVY